MAGAATTIFALSDATNMDAVTHKTAYFTPIVGTGKTISSVILMKLYRNSSDAADTYTGLAYFIEFDIHYQSDTPGSRTQGAK
jgi:hypothetical protein